MVIKIIGEYKDTHFIENVKSITDNETELLLHTKEGAISMNKEDVEIVIVVY